MFLQFEKTLTFTTQKVTFKCSLGTWIFIKSHGTQQEIQITVIDPIQFRFDNDAGQSMLLFNLQIRFHGFLRYSLI